jgi:PfaD family protein
MLQLLAENSLATGWWIAGDHEPTEGESALIEAIEHASRPVYLLDLGGRPGVGRGGTLMMGDPVHSAPEGYPVCAWAPRLRPEDLGDPAFRRAHGLRYAYVGGAMAKGITSVEMVKEMGRAGMIGFFGAAGLPLDEVEAAIDRLQSLEVIPFGFNLIHSPHDPELEMEIVSLYLKRGIRLVSASAYLDLTLPLVYFRVKGIHRDPSGRIVCRNKVVAKVSRVEVAQKFFSPPPDKLLKPLVQRGMITKAEADLAGSVPMADSLTAEADSGGHTDNRPALALLPTMLALRDGMAQKYKYSQPLFVGLGGGIATPYSTAAAFAMGAAFVLTGSINQSCVEAGTSETVRRMLAETQQADVTMAPAADMFEMGVKVQVLKRGTMFPLRAAKLYEFYRQYESIDEIPQKQRTVLERDYFRCSLEEEWQNTKRFFGNRDPKQIERAEKDAKHKMALIFRSYLGQASTWANMGDPTRKIDYQIWCGPSMGAFNEWVKGSFLERPENRKVVTAAMNLLMGAAVATRANWLRSQGADLPANAGKFSPRPISEIQNLLTE